MMSILKVKLETEESESRPYILTQYVPKGLF